VRTSLQRVADKATTAKQGIARWSAIRREQLYHWWLRRRGHPVTIHRRAPGGATAHGGITATGVRGGVDRDTISDRKWLAHLDSQVSDLWAHMTRAEEQRAADRVELEQRLHAQRNELRGEIKRETRQGWQLILAGLAWSAAGTVVGIVG
jgi:hypothetical protein